MAYQPKSYRKFVATAATATLVASAVTPAFAAQDFTDVGSRYKEAVDYLVKNNLTKGINETQFGVDQQIKRVDFAIILAKAVLTQQQIDNAKASNFTDVPSRGVKEVNALKEAGIVNGKTDTRFGANDEITRGEAALMFANAYKIKGDAKNVNFTDVSDRYKDAVAALVDKKITSGKTDSKFGTQDPIKRGEFAIFLYKLETMDETPQPGVSKVEAINDTKLEVSFAKAISEDLAMEIEKSGKRFVVFHGGQTAQSDNIIQSKTISFNAERTKAEVILADTPALEADVNYTVALMDGDNNAVSSVVEKFGPQVLKKGADTPEFTINGDQDKVVLDFKTKMADEAKTVANYEVYENDTKLGVLSDYVVTGDGEWVDPTDKKSVEFKLDKAAAKGLLAGKTYKIKVADAVKTDDGKQLSDSQRTITVKTPAISEAQPTAKVARVVGDTIVVTFDKDLGTEHFNEKQITVKKPGGQTLNVTSIAQNASPKELVLGFDAGALDADLTYTIDLPSNGVENAYFANASNKEVKGLKAEAQKDIEVTSVTAKLQQQVDNKDKADLLLTFNQRVDVAALNTATTDAIVIKDGADTYELNASPEAAVYPGDTTGKTVVIKDVTSKFTLAGGTDTFIPEDGASYTIEFKAGVVKTDAGTDAKTNQEKLKATVGGVSISAPEFDKIRMNSAEEIVVEFAEDIDAKNLRASDIKVKGFELYDNGKFAADATLQGDSQIKFSVSGNQLKIQPANSKVKFVTGDVTDLVTVAAETIKGKSSGVANALELSSADVKPANIIDRANPIMIGATKKSANALDITYSEAVDFKGTDTDKQAAQFTVENASKAAYGTAATASTGLISVTFNETDTFKPDLDLAKVKVKYTKNLNVLVKDDKGNEALSQTITGVKPQ
ncbi:S-layer homology domain-containing protein [Bacillus sp. PK3_68]|uniref:S-layer homology domain-containing protein n=1 Tax=Bacillus sp. PK3_68 TaxID=2027408 RepID=UPI000E71F454|nr:S-layer homology domain-containing protein [Bacillus sp. PK3_68]RJS60690.1 hypothetical protein CJ483_11900 [Bacillus sp. PK3_68]